MINKGIGFCQQCLCFPYGREDEHHALVAFAVQTMRHYVCALLGAISAQVAFALLLPLRRMLVVMCSVLYLSKEATGCFSLVKYGTQNNPHTAIPDSCAAGQ